MTTWAYQYFELSSLGSSFCQEVQILLYIWQKWFFCIYDRNYIWQQLTEQKRNQRAYPWRKKKDSKLRPWEMSLRIYISSATLPPHTQVSLSLYFNTQQKKSYPQPWTPSPVAETRENQIATSIFNYYLI